MASRARVVPLTTSEATLVVLAGGQSTRMGRSKPDLAVGDLTLLEWLVGRLGPSFAETIVCGGPARRGARAVVDRRPAAGPLAGIEAGLGAMRTERAFVLAVDVPRASARLADLLLARADGHDAAIPRVAGRDQMTCAAYGRSALPVIAAYLDGGGRRVSALVAKLEVAYVDEQELAAAGIAAEELADLDTPAEYESFLGSLRT